MKLAGLAVIGAAAAIAFAAPAHAEIDTDFANELHTFGIYGQRDYNAWIAKIMCKGRRRQHHRRLPELPTQRHVRLGLALTHSTRAGFRRRHGGEIQPVSVSSVTSRSATSAAA
nr:hypothetical protein [Mycolicibacterium fortuitum]